MQQYRVVAFLYKEPWTVLYLHELYGDQYVFVPISELHISKG
jgi:hypothetical protein